MRIFYYSHSRRRHDPQPVASAVYRAALYGRYLAGLSRVGVGMAARFRRMPVLQTRRAEENAGLVSGTGDIGDGGQPVCRPGLTGQLLGRSHRMPGHLDHAAIDTL